MAIVQTHSGNGVATSAITYTADAGDIIVIGIGAHSHTNYCKIKSITDQDGLTWHRRRQTKFTFPYTSNSSDRAVLEYWWAFTSAARTSRQITITFDTTSNLDYSQAFWATFSGVGNTAKPWASSAAGFVQNYGNASTRQFMTPSVTASATGDKLIGFMAALTKSPASVPAINGTTAIGAGVTSTGTAQSVGGTTNNAPSASTFQWNWNNDQFGYVSIGDALGITASPAGDDSDLTSAPSVTSVDQLAPGNTVPATASYNATADQLLVLFVMGEADGGYMPVSSVSDGTLTYTRRGQTQLQSLNVGSGQAEYVDAEVWWAHTPVAFTGRTLTINFTTGASSGHRNIIALLAHVDGVQDPAAPWDNDASAHNVNAYTNASTKLANPSVATVNSQYNDLSLGWCWEEESSGSGGASTAGSGFTQDSQLVRGTASNRVWISLEHKTQTAAGSVTTARSDGTGKLNWILIADALSGTMQGTASDTGATGATAGGSTITITASIIAGSVNVSEEANVLTLTTSIIAGSAFEQVFANGATIPVVVSLLEGVATGDAIAVGDTLTLTTSLIPGAASVTEEAALLILTTSIFPGTALVDDTAPGDTIEIDLSIIAGEGGAAQGGGSELVLLIEFHPGSAVSGGIGPGATLPLIVTLFPGTASATGVDGTASGSILPIVVSILPGQATGETNGDAAGDTLTIFTSIQSGAAEAPPAASNGDLLTLGIELIPGYATGTSSSQRVSGGPIFGPPNRNVIVNATAEGAVISSRIDVTGGSSHVREEIIREVIVEVPVGSAPLIVSNANATGAEMINQMILEAGKARGDVVVKGETLEARKDFTEYDNEVLALIL